MPFTDWEAVFRNYRIEWITKGRNVKRGNINICCPFCGRGDVGFHMGIDLTTGYYGCWRDKKHRGRGAHRLLIQLLGISYADADEIVNDSSKVTATMNDLKSRAQEVLGKKVKVKQVIEKFPSCFTSVNDCPRARRYLVDRGFRKQDLRAITKLYSLKFANDGDWKSRLILPVISINNKLIGWTGRAVGKSTLRYLAYPKGNLVKGHVFNGQNVLEGGKVLVIVEGPLDVLKIDFYGQKHAVRAVGLMSTSMKPAQAAAIIKLAKKFARVRIMFDSGVAAQQLGIPSQLPGLSVKRATLLNKPRAFDDPGAIPYSVIYRQISLILGS